jgi:TRAP-type C4-dicarboxylate transport system permease small subunit
VLSTVERLVAALARVNAPLLAACRLATALLLAVIAVVIAVSVIWRYGLNSALSWSEEVAKYAMVWLAFAGAPLALPLGGHVGVDVLPNALPARARHALVGTVMLLVAGLMAAFVHFGTRFAWNGRVQVMAMIGDASMAWVFVAIPLGSAVLGLVAVELAGRHWLHALAPELFRAPETAADQMASVN